MSLSLPSIFAATIAASFISGAALAQTRPASATSPSDIQTPAAATTVPVVKPRAPPIPDPHWLSPEELKAVIATVPAPPAPGSPADQADLQTEIDVQNSRTPERSLQAKKDASLDMSLFLKDVNPTLNAKNDPKLYFLLQQVHYEEDRVNGPSKGRFHRMRPFVAHADVIHPLGKIGGFSYPSGHATIAFCHAVILGQIFPDKAALFLDDAKRIAQSRVVMGVHYTTDIHEGERDGREIARELLTKPDFLVRLAEVKAEIRQQP
jgi:acid phosphatase (class A)